MLMGAVRMLLLRLAVALVAIGCFRAGEATSSSRHVVDAVKLGHPFAGIGAQSTAGTGRLLRDYAETPRGEILDLLFSPQHGAALQHIKVEIGGDAQITCGAEASHWRTGESSPNFARGYEWWLMQEAKARNPDIQLLGLVYAWPSWIGNATVASPQWPWASSGANARAASYVVSWVTGARDVHNLTIDNV